jgi:hypothetical protein
MSTLSVDTIQGKTTAETLKLPSDYIVQVVHITSSTKTNHSNNSFTDTGFDATITPRYDNSKILVLGNFSIYLSGAQQNNVAETAVYRNDSTVLGKFTVRAYDYGSSGVLMERPVSMNFLDSPATTSTVTYTLYTKMTSGNTLIFNDDADDSSSFTLMEISQ